MDCLGYRLRQERKRLRLTQAEFATIGGIAQNAQGHYESGKRIPKADYLQRLGKAGVDVLYLLAGGAEILPVGTFVQPSLRAIRFSSTHFDDAVGALIDQLSQTLSTTAATIATVATIASPAKDNAAGVRMAENLKDFDSYARRFVNQAYDLGQVGRTLNV